LSWFLPKQGATDWLSYNTNPRSIPPHLAARRERKVADEGDEKRDFVGGEALLAKLLQFARE
jgi:hypothetical protein